MRKALLIVDIQNDYFADGTNPLAGSDKASENAKLILEKFRTDGLPVVHVQHIATKPSATFFLPGTFGAEIHRNVKPLENETVVVKHYPNSFRETSLLDYLKNLAVTDLVICGMMTHMCIDATTRAAKDYGFACTVIADACATKYLEIMGEKVKASEVHNSFLAALAYFYADVKTTKAYLEEMV